MVTAYHRSPRPTGISTDDQLSPSRAHDQHERGSEPVVKHPTPLQRVHGSSPWRCTQTSRSDRLSVWPVSFFRRSSRRLVDEDSSGEGPRWLGHRSRSAAMARSSSPAAGASGSLVAGTEISTGRPLARGRPTVSRLDLYSAATEARIAALRADSGRRGLSASRRPAPANDYFVSEPHSGFGAAGRVKPVGQPGHLPWNYSRSASHREVTPAGRGRP